MVSLGDLFLFMFPHVPFGLYASGSRKEKSHPKSTHLYPYSSENDVMKEWSFYA